MNEKWDSYLREFFLKGDQCFFILEKDKLVFVNDSFVQKIGYHKEEILGRSLLNFIHPDDVQKLLNKIRICYTKKQPYLTSQVRMRTSIDDTLYVIIRATQVSDEQTPTLIGIIEENTKKKVEKEIQAIRYYDYLTAVGNRRLIEETLHHEIKNAHAYTIFSYMQLDLDGFKFINDSLGHEYGDLLLKKIAKKLQDEFEQKGIVARTGGDEFAILLRDIPNKEAITLEAEKVISLFKEPFMVKNYEFYITASLGVSIYPHSGTSPKEMLKNAELAMYHAKKLGKNRFSFYTPTLKMSTYKEFTLHNDLRKALINDEFTLYYQPRVNSRTKKIVGAEALIRWNHPTWGIVSPIEFIKIAENSGVIIPIGKWVFEQACQQIAQWKKDGIQPFVVSINISALQFLQTDFAKMIKTTIEQYKIDPDLIEIEITESTFLDKEKAVLNKIRNLKKFGLRITIDDFGTGYSALHYLTKIKVDTIKIDESFVKDLENSYIETNKIVSSIIQLAKSLNIRVVAEGIETLQQSVILEKMGCEEFQGYLFGKPIPAEKFKEMLILDSKKTGEQNRTDTSFVNKRKFFRVQLSYPLEANMTIDQIDGKKVTLGSTYVLIDNIGPGGQSFFSNIKLPIRPNFTLKFNTTILGKEIELYGKVVWSKEHNAEITQYGVEYELDDDQRSKIILILNQLQVKLRQEPFLKNCRFIKMDLETYFKKNK